MLHVDQLPPLAIFGFFFLSGFLQIAFPIYPGDTVLVFGGCLGGLDIGSAATLALAGYLSATLIASLLLYELGYRLTDRIFSIRFIQRIMPLERRAYVEGRYRKFGIGLLAVCKFIPGVNTLVILVGGVLRYPRRQGMTAVALSSVVHNVVFFYVGHTLGRNLYAIERFIRDYTIIAASAFGALAIVLLTILILKNRKGKTQP